MTAGPGHDRFYFEFAPVVGQVETIKNFNPALDKIYLSETTDFMNIGTHGTLQAGHFHVGAAVGTGSQIVYTPGNGYLYYDPNGKMDIVKIAGLWMRNDDGTPTRAYKHICWDGCMFPNAMMTSPETWVKILATLIRVRDAHGWD